MHGESEPPGQQTTIFPAETHAAGDENTTTQTTALCLWTAAMPSTPAPTSLNIRCDSSPGNLTPKQPNCQINHLKYRDMSPRPKLLTTPKPTNPGLQNEHATNNQPRALLASCIAQMAPALAHNRDQETNAALASTIVHTEPERQPPNKTTPRPRLQIQLLHVTGLCPITFMALSPARLTAQGCACTGSRCQPVA